MTVHLDWRLHTNPFYDSDSRLYFDLGNTNIVGAQFSTIAQGGFGDASIDIGEPPKALIRQALDNWLMKRVVAYDGAGRIAYEGFVAEIDATLDRQQFFRSLDSFANRVYVEHKYRSGQGTACPKGATCRGRQTRDEDDVATTQTLVEWGMKTATVDINGLGHVGVADAQEMGDRYLKSALRASQVQFEPNIDVAAPNHLSLSIWGYYSTLQWNVQTKAYRTATDIADVVKGGLSTVSLGGGNTSVAQFISTDQSQIATTGNTIKYNLERKRLNRMDFIQGALLEGDSNRKQLFFQILENRRPHLFSRPSSALYFATDDLSLIWDASHNAIPPYLVRAGGYIVTENFNEAIDPISDVQNRRHTSLVDRTIYDDMTGKVVIPPTDNLATPERILSRVYRGTKKHLFT